MNPEIKAAWVAALRSGEYSQGRGRLRNDHAFCCLGVLCDLHRKAGLGEWRNTVYVPFGDIPESMQLPSAVDRWAGITNDRITRGVLPAYNDGDIDNQIGEHSFGQIADYIEQHL